MTGMVSASLLILFGILILIVLQVALLLRRPGGADDLAPKLDALMKLQGERDRQIREDLKGLSAEQSTHGHELRQEVGGTLRSTGDSLVRAIGEISAAQKQQLETFSQQLGKLTESNETRLEAMRTAVETKLKEIREDNTKQLEQMRQTVDEKLQGTLEKRLGDSFKLVSDRLEQVHKGLGEMQALASGVGDLKKMLTNVKTRGTWGEIQLGSLLEQVLTPDQYEQNVALKEGSGERVEFAIRMPGRDDAGAGPVWLPIDAKFPQEDYLRIVEASERGDKDGLEVASRQLETRIRLCAKDICDKYLNPPRTTNFGVLFLPTEGLYAEVLRRPGLVEQLQRDYRVNVAGPTTLAALLNSLQMGFRTLAIQKRSSEVWSLLSVVKTEFGKFGDALDAVRDKLQQASSRMDDTFRRTRVLERKLRDVQELPAGQAPLLPAPDDQLELADLNADDHGK
ncbi:MAG TPA: DNA recombination protein RmuC [Vicinamibacterales bacterium]|nr:DNA recombination protein RmuC [Vicinamibacterales bacterium]